MHNLEGSADLNDTVSSIPKSAAVEADIHPFP